MSNALELPHVCSLSSISFRTLQDDDSLYHIAYLSTYLLLTLKPSEEWARIALLPILHPFSSTSFSRRTGRRRPCWHYTSIIENGSLKGLPAWAPPGECMNLLPFSKALLVSNCTKIYMWVKDTKKKTWELTISLEAQKLCHSECLRRLHVWPARSTLLYSDVDVWNSVWCVVCL